MAKIFQLEDIKKIEANPAPTFAVFGKPISHSLSPAMQNSALNKIAATDKAYKNSKYIAVEVAPSDLENALKILWDKKFYGINLTIPHKEIAVKMMSQLDASAKDANACNTLLRTRDGWKGYNTDGFGISQAIRKNFGKSFRNKDVVIFGAGGAARGAAFQAAKENCKTLLIANRNAERAKKLKKDLSSKGFNCDVVKFENAVNKISKSAIIINATSVGLKKSDPAVLDFSKLPKSVVFFDMPYIKGKETPSVIAARKFNIKAASGLSMLAWQGAKALSIWTKKPMLGELMLKKLKEQK